MSMVEFEKVIFPYEEVLLAYYDCRKRKRRTRNALDFELRDSEKLYNLFVELNSNSYSIDRSITFCVEKPVKREIFAASFKDRIIHHLIINKLNPYFEKEFIFDTYSCRKGKGTYLAVLQCYKMIEEASQHYTIPTYIVKCDLHSFFMNINKDILYDKLSAFIDKIKDWEEGEDLSYLLPLIKQVIYNCPQLNCIRKLPVSAWKDLPKHKSLFNCPPLLGLPIGNLTSQIFANLYLSDFDHFMKDLLHIKWYGRYVDDFFFIIHNTKDAKPILNVITDELKKVGITLSPRKLYILEIKKGIKFVGSVLKPNRIYISNRTKGSFISALKKLSDLIINRIPTLDELEHFIGSINSYLGFMIHYKTYKIRKKILSSSYMNKWKPFCKIGECFEKILRSSHK